jgi:Glycosyl transferases group 1
MRQPRCLMFYPWNLSDQSGALSLFLSYSKALKEAGYRLDCYAPRAAGNNDIFDNVFVAPDSRSPVTRLLEFAGAQAEDHGLPDRIGRDEASMVAAAVLTSISDYDIVGVQYTRCHSLKDMLPPGMPTVMFTHDLDSLVGRQEQIIFGTPLEYKLEDEISRLKPFDLVTAVGPDDRRLLQSAAPDMQIIEAPFTFPLQHEITIRDSSPGKLLWISSAAPFHRFSFFWFWKRVWPRIKTAHPGCRFVIAGRMSEVAKQLGAGTDAQVDIRGMVPDAWSLYRETDILIAPYYFGLGIKTKVIEGLANGVPVATTTLGIYNTHIEPTRHAVVSDDASEYADQVIHLLSSPHKRRELSRNGLEYIRTWHDPDKALLPFVRAFDEVRQRRSASGLRSSSLRELYEPLRHLVPWTIQRCQVERTKRVAIYGAGNHTRLLLPIWQSLGGPRIRCIVVTGQPEETVFMGYPVVSADRFDPEDVDGIVLSSHGYEEQMAQTCSERWPQTNIYPIWRPVLEPEYTDLTDGFEALCQQTIPASLYNFL